MVVSKWFAYEVLRDFSEQFGMDSEKCLNCLNETFYYCVKCSTAVCNRPSCSSPVASTVNNYSENHPKKVSKCKKCLANKASNCKGSTQFNNSSK